jgi:hypothetical protein
VASKASHCQSCPRYFINQLISGIAEEKLPTLKEFCQFQQNQGQHKKNGFGHKFNLKE